MGFLLLFDLTNEQSFLEVRNWLELLKVLLCLCLVTYQIILTFLIINLVRIQLFLILSILLYLIKSLN